MNSISLTFLIKFKRNMRIRQYSTSYFLKICALSHKWLSSEDNVYVLENHTQFMQDLRAEHFLVARPHSGMYGRWQSSYHCENPIVEEIGQPSLV